MEAHEFKPITSLADVEYNEAVPLAARNLSVNTFEIFKRSAAIASDKTALRYLFQGAETKDKSISYSYNNLLARIAQTANALRALGISNNDVVTIFLPNLPQNHFALWGAEAVGIASPINPMLEVSHIVSIMNQTKAKVLVTLAPFPGTKLWVKAQEIAKKVPSLKTIITIDMRQFLSIDKRPSVETLPEKINDIFIYDFDDRIAQADTTFNCNKTWDDTAAYFHTGGTTGAPKIAKQSHGNQVFCSWMVGKLLNWNEQDVMHCGLPMFHVNAPLITGLAPFTVGGEVLMTSPQGFRSPTVLDAFADLIKEYQISFFMAVPTIFSELNLRWKDRSDIHTLTSLRFAACGAAPLPPAVIAKFKQITHELTDFTILEGYGLTEGTVFSTATPPFSRKELQHSIGIRIPYQQMEIAEINEIGEARILGDNKTGTIIIRGPNVFQGYLNESENEHTWVHHKGKWLNTGDLAWKNTEGYFFLTGREKDIIIRAGHNIDPKLIEEPLSQHPDVAIVAAIGKPDKRFGELPMAYVQLRKDAIATASDLHAYAKSKISEHAAIPQQIEIIAEMPLTSVGKIFKPALRILSTKQVIENELADFKSPNINFATAVTIDHAKGLTATITFDKHDESMIKNIHARLEKYNIEVIYQLVS